MQGTSQGGRATVLASTTMLNHLPMNAIQAPGVNSSEKVIANGVIPSCPIDAYVGVGGLMSLCTAEALQRPQNPHIPSLRVPVAIRPVVLANVVPVAAEVPIQRPVSAQGVVPGTSMDIPIRPNKRARPALANSGEGSFAKKLNQRHQQQEMGFQERNPGFRIHTKPPRPNPEHTRPGFAPPLPQRVPPQPKKKEPRPKKAPKKAEHAASIPAYVAVPGRAVISGEPTPAAVAPKPPAPVQVTKAKTKTKTKTLGTHILGHDVRLVHSLIAHICEWTLSKEKVVKFDWKDVAATLDPSANLSASECQALWRYVAYHMDSHGESIDPNFKFDTASLNESDSDIDLPPTAMPRLNTTKKIDAKILPKRPKIKRKWTTGADVKLLKGILEYGEGNWDVVRRQFGLLKRENKALETRWRVMQRSVSAGRYKNERVVSLIAAIKQKNTIPEISSVDVQTAADALHDLMGMV